MQTHLTATEHHLSYETCCYYLPHDIGEHALP